MATVNISPVMINIHSLYHNQNREYLPVRSTILKKQVKHFIKYLILLVKLIKFGEEFEHLPLCLYP